MKQLITIFAITALVIVLTGSYNTKAQTPSDTSRLSVSGLLDVNFNKNFNNPSDHINGYPGESIQSQFIKTHFAEKRFCRLQGRYWIWANYGIYQCGGTFRTRLTIIPEKHRAGVYYHYLTGRQRLIG
jgi:hypothetical protein